MRPETVVCDTGPVLHLQEAEALDLLSLIDSVYVPWAVDRELMRLVGDWPAHRPRQLQVVELETGSAEQAAHWTAAGLLHRAESEALALAHHVKAHWYLTDDTAARELAKSLGVEAHGSLGLVLWAAAHGHLSRLRSAARLEALFGSSLWVSPSIREQARDALKRIHSPS
ncbi:MAG: DNA-binding protein [Verrucomicrobia bacterium]|nr:DNA-binding protein [Verrucomicrobiota bacterium]